MMFIKRNIEEWLREYKASCDEIVDSVHELIKLNNDLVARINKVECTLEEHQAIKQHLS